ncbi:UvrD-helicase domain-containing protein [Echinicola marina]|uniref:UvrD-helicase domain-containing protein n=1 Tax=Echinicola marina TaxID=2859768 RepID=UPI001CF69A41|nr:UvrD-helicase domain-containing protein [Echinicola marina]UCS93177.1 UvrD-helicase domain-containing protein [Echinicola marina]
MDQKPFIIYKSSAGSGKTYTLTLEYLKLALVNETAFKSILAVTFTNKATQEMKSRILEELARLKIEVNPTEFLDQELMKHLGTDAQELQVRAGKVLSAILHDYAQFSVSTIDSFFQKVVRAFAREIDLQAKFDIALDQEAVLEQVVDRVVQNVLEDQYLHKWLVDYALTQIQNGKSWDIRANIKSLGREIFTENFKQYQQFIREFLSNEENIEAFKKYLEQRRKEIVDNALALKRQANELRQQFGLEWSDFSRGFASKFDKLGIKEEPVPELTGPQKELVHDESKWATKSSKLRDTIFSAYYAGLGEMWGKLIPMRAEWLTFEAINKNFYAYGLFRNLLDELRDFKDEENLLMISDANDFLKEITKENDAPFIYEKVGNQYRHFLIDEFQDTSSFQWESFKPLLENSLAQGNKNLLVGDVKQSIYRWRGGDMKLLLEKVEEDIGDRQISVKNLDTNYRSLPNIVDFNNALFKLLPEQLQLSFSKQVGLDGGDILVKAYEDVAQKVSGRKSSVTYKGKVRMEFLEESRHEELKFKDKVVERLPEMVMQLQDKGYEPKDIAFLVRRKSEGAMIADALMAYKSENPALNYNFEVVSDESMFLDRAATVKALVAGLQFLLDPEDKVPFQTMWFYWSSLHQKEIGHDIFGDKAHPVWLEEKIKAFISKQALLSQLPLFEMVEELIVLLDFYELKEELAYVSGFKEAVYDYVLNSRADLVGFLSWWEENSTKRTVKIPEGHNAMSIMTIHKSKGLQFKVVLMPFLSWEIVDFKKDNIIWSPFKDSAHNMQAIIPLTMRKELAESVFQPIHEEEVTMSYLDTLNMIYVALTRAEEVLWTLSPYKALKTAPSLNPIENNIKLIFENGRLRTEKEDLTTFYDSEKKLFDWGEWPEEAKDIENVQYSPTTQFSWKYRDWSELLKVKTNAVDFSEEGLKHRQKRNFGLLIHELLEQSRNKKEAFSFLQSYYFEGRLDKNEMLMVEEQLENLFSNKVFNDWFEGPGEMLTEQGIILPGGMQKRPDRVILLEDKAIVVDFKTGEEKEQYFKQVKGYIALLEELGHKMVKGYLCYLETGKIIEVK